MVLVDTNIIVALLVRNTPWFSRARTMYERDDDWRSESHAMVELTNVLTRYVRVGEFEEAPALDMLDAAQARFAGGLYLVSHSEAMRMALARKVSAYDARFLVAAQSLGTRLVTEDTKLRRAAPELTQSLDQVLAA